VAFAVSAVLAEVFSQPTAWDDLGDWWALPGFQARPEPVSQAESGPHSEQNPWQPQAGHTNKFKMKHQSTKQKREEGVVDDQDS
jgi:hypothetical protein